MSNIEKIDWRIPRDQKQRIVCDKINEVIDILNGEKYGIITETNMAGINLYDTYREAIENLQYKGQQIFRVRAVK